MVVGMPAAAVAVRLEQRTGVVLQHTVGHDLDAGGVEVADHTVLALGEELGDLFEALVPVPPERADHSGGQPPVRASER